MRPMWAPRYSRKEAPQMQKKLFVACATLAALTAFSVTPTASASPVLTESGTAVAVGSSITAKNTGNIFFTVGEMTLACENLDIKGTVLTNSGITLQSKEGTSFTGTGAGGDCTSSISPFRVIMTSQLCFQAEAFGDKVVATGCGSEIKFTLEFTSLGGCKYRTVSFPGTYATNADATFTFSTQPYLKAEGGIFCPGNGQLDMDLDLTTTDGTTLLIS